MAKRTKQIPTCSKCGDAHPAPEPRCTRYNGWSNYETWLVHLWMTNDQGSDSYWREQARDTVENAIASPVSHLTTRQVARIELADRMKHELYEENEDLPDSGMVADLIGSAFSEVNWHEIAEHFYPAEAEVGSRVQMPAHTDEWMQGERYGVVMSQTGDKSHVLLDKSKRRVWVPTAELEGVR